MDPRYQRLAELLVRHSCKVQPGEHLLLELFDAPADMAVAMVEATRAAGGHPHVELRSNRVMRALNKGSAEDGLRTWGTHQGASLDLRQRNTANPSHCSTQV